MIESVKTIVTIACFKPPISLTVYYYFHLFSKSSYLNVKRNVKGSKQYCWLQRMLQLSFLWFSSGRPGDTRPKFNLFSMGSSSLKFPDAQAVTIKNDDMSDWNCTVKNWLLKEKHRKTIIHLERIVIMRL